jgi:plastocyanin
MKSSMSWLKLGLLFVGGACGSLIATSSAMGQEWADLKMTFVYDGKAPAPKPVDASKDPICLEEGNKIVTETLVVNPSNGGIRYIALSLDVKDVSKLKIHPDLAKAPADKPLLDNVKCVFVPHVVVMRAGQTLEVKNSDKTGHNANFGFFKNDAQNVTVPSGGSKDLLINKEETAPTPVECNIHPWMKCYVIVKEHPYVGVSDADGNLVIKGLPAGEELKFRVWHENQNKAISEVTINGKKEKWDRGYVTMTLKPGENNVGTIKLTPDRFK